MKPILYDASENQFLTNGIGILSDAIDATVLRRMNGEYELEMVYPVAGIHFFDIRQRSVLLCKVDTYSRLQPFRVYKISKPMNRRVTVYARHIAYDMMGIPVAPFSAQGVQAALAAMKGAAAVECPFTFWTDKDSDTAISIKTPRAMWNMLGGMEGSLLDVYGGEYEFDRWDVKMNSHLGMDRGVSIRYGKNLTDLKQDENCEGCYTGIYPYWADAEGTCVELDEQIIYAEGEFGYTRILTLDLSAEFTEKPTQDQLRAKTETYIQEHNIGVPEVSWKISFVQLEQTEEYAGKALLEQVTLGDTVTVEFAEMGISTTARVTETRYKPILERFDSVSLGDVRADFADIVVSTKREAESKPSVSKMEAAIQLLTTIILGAKGGAVRLLDTNNDGLPDTIYIADDPDPSKAVKVWRFNYEGWGASKTGYNGPFVMGATLEAGFLADFITAGTLDANLVSVINLCADNIVSGLISVDRLDVDNLIVKHLYAEDSDGYAIYVGAGCLDFYDNDRWIGSLDRGQLTIMFDETAVDQPTAVYNQYGMQLTMQGNVTRFGMGLDAKGYATLDILNISGNGNCHWEYVESLGAKVLVLDE